MTSSHSNGICIDSHAWPSRYYGRTRRIDLAQVYCDTLVRARTEKQQMTAKKSRRKVCFTTDPPVVHEYEREEEQEQDLYRCKRYDGDGHLRISMLDLRPIPNSTFASLSPSSTLVSSSSLADDNNNSSSDDDDDNDDEPKRFQSNKPRSSRPSSSSSPSSPLSRTFFSYDTLLRVIIRRKMAV